MILVTGAAGGIGLATAVRAAQCGAAAVAIADLDAARLAEAAPQVRAAGAECLEMVTDLRVADQVEHMVGQTVSWAGSLDVLVNNAGVFETMFTDATSATLVGCPEDVWDAVHDVNVKAMWLATKHAAPHLLASSRTPAVVNVASVAGLTGYGPPAYTSSKGAAIQLTRSAAVNLAPTVRVNCVCPGTVRTPMTVHAASRQVAHRGHLINRLGESEEIASVITFLASADASFMTGAVVPVDGGTTAWRGLRED